MIDGVGQMGTDTYSLGTLTAEYKPRSVAPILRLLFGFGLGTASIFLMLYGAESSQVSGGDRAPIVIIGGLMLGFSWLMIEVWVKGRGLIVRVFTDGLARSQYGKT